MNVPQAVKALRNQRIRRRFGVLLDADPVSVYRWEVGKAFPDEANRLKLYKLALQEDRPELARIFLPAAEQIIQGVAGLQPGVQFGGAHTSPYRAEIIKGWHSTGRMP